MTQGGRPDPPVIVAPEHRPDYLDALEARQLADNPEPFESFMAARLIQSLDQYLDAIEKELEARPRGPEPTE